MIHTYLFWLRLFLVSSKNPCFQIPCRRNGCASVGGVRSDRALVLQAVHRALSRALGSS